MAENARYQKMGFWMVGLRALLMLLAGLYAVIFPLQALAALVLIGGVLFLVDGALGLWAITFGGAKTGNYWFDVVRNALAIVMGVLILLSPILATVLTTTLLVYLVAAQALIVGGMEIFLIIKERESYAKIWPVLLSGALYVIFGLLLIAAPLVAATVFVIFGGVLAIIFSIGLFAIALRLRT